MITKQRVIDMLKNILTDMTITDESRLDDNILSELIDQARTQLIIQRYKETRVVDQSWLTDLGFVDFWRVNFANDPNITFCNCDISNGFVPKVVALNDSTGNADIGMYAVMSACGTKKYYQKSIELWKDIPAEHIYSKFNYYFRVDTSMYVNKQVEKLRIIAILENPEDGFVIQSRPLEQGDLEAGQTYIVKYKQITYNSTVIAPNATFIAQAGITTWTGNGSIYLADQLQQLTRTQPYPISSDMARQIVLDICVKEFKIAESQIPDILNDDQDDEVQSKKPVQSN